MKKIVITQNNGMERYLDQVIKDPIGGTNVCLVSSADSDIGYGNIIQIPFGDLKQIDYGEEGILVTYLSGKQPVYLEGFDIAFIGNLEHWAANQGYELIYKN